MDIDYTNPNFQQAHKNFRRIQIEHGWRFTPVLSIKLGIEYNEAIAKDPTGLQALRYTRDLEERLQPLKM